MSKSLARACLGCGKKVRGRSWCPGCWSSKEKAKSSAKRAARPDLHDDRQERERRRRVVARWRADVGDWCPGVPELGLGAHPAANLSADHVFEVGQGHPANGPLVVRCVPCNAARSAAARTTALAKLGGSPIDGSVSTPLPVERPITHRDGDNPGPVAA